MAFQPQRVAIFIFDDVEVLDFCGPLEVFGVTQTEDGSSPFEVVTVAATLDPVMARNQLSVNPQYSIANCPPVDLLLIPGGAGTRALLHQPDIIEWIRSQAASVDYLLSVCTGALLLAQAGLLAGLAATTHHTTFDLLRRLAPQAEVRMGDRIVDNGAIVLSGGISAGIDMALYMVSRLCGASVAIATATEMEYDWHPDQLSIYRPTV
jgi:transcriptional regulator GlxA family with amidase domain